MDVWTVLIIVFVSAVIVLRTIAKMHKVTRDYVEETVSQHVVIHDEHITLLMQAMANLMVGILGYGPGEGQQSTENVSGNMMSMSCPHADKSDPEDIKCKNESNETGKCETIHCPFLS